MMTIEQFKVAFAKWCYTNEKPNEVSDPRWRGMLRWAERNLRQ